MNRARSTLLVITILIILLLLISVIEPILKHYYPLKYADVIGVQANKHDLDPLLIAALIHVESKWKEVAVSPMEAVGLMQLMPETAHWIATEIDLDYASLDLFDPETNITLGCWYLKYLHMQLPSFTAALAAYNGGQGNVRRWLNEGVWDGSMDSIAEIPFAETRTYIKRIAHTWDIYQRLYDDHWGD